MYLCACKHVMCVEQSNFSGTCPFRLCPYWFGNFRVVCMSKRIQAFSSTSPLCVSWARAHTHTHTHTLVHPPTHTHTHTHTLATFTHPYLQHTHKYTHACKHIHCLFRVIKLTPQFSGSVLSQILHSRSKFTVGMASILMCQRAWQCQGVFSLALSGPWRRHGTFICLV